MPLNCRLDNYFSNREFVEKRRTKKNDKSVIYSIYMKEDRTAFNDTCMIHGLEYMHRTNENKQPNVPDSKNHLTNADLVDAVSTSLGDLPLNYNDNDYSDKFVIYALTDLMNVMYQISHGTVRKVDAEFDVDP